MIERAHQVEALIGEREALAMAQHRPRQLHAGHAIDDLGLDRHQMLEVELVRHLEERTVEMPLLPFRIVQRPGGVLGEGGDLRGRRLDLELCPDQVADGQREGQFPGFQPVGELYRQRKSRRDGRAVERGGDVRLEGARDVALHEEPLAVVERRQATMTFPQRGCFGADGEQGADEVLQRPRHFDQEIGLVLCGKTVGGGARGHQAGMSVDVGVPQPGHEGGIKTGDPFTVVKIVEAEPVRERRGQLEIRHKRGSGARGQAVRIRTD